MCVRRFPIHLPEAVLTYRPDGSVLVSSSERLGPYPDRVADRLQAWATATPDRVLFASRSGAGWRTVSYREALEAARAIGQALLDRNVSAAEPVLILSGNGIEHGLLSLACQLVGVPFAPVSVAYSLVSTDFARLRDIVGLLRPKLVFADDGTRYAAALRACVPADTEVVIVHGDPGRPATRFDRLLATNATSDLESAAAAVGADSVAKILFTSGSTGAPKGVIGTHRMWCASLAMLGACYPALAEEPPVLVDWLPWSHVLGGSVSFGVALFNGGTFYIDDGKPVPSQMETTVRNLRDVAPLFYSSVPSGYEALVPWLRREPALRKNFFSCVRVFQYSGASIAREVCEAFDELALATVGERIPWVSVLGSTEAGFIAAHRQAQPACAGRVGLPPPGVTLKLVPTDGKLAARVRGPGVTPGYWRRDDLTAAAFDEEGFLQTGDALDWVDARRPHSGLRYGGRIAEDFKLVTGTWVRAGALRTTLLQRLTPEVRDVVIAGENRDYIAVLGIPATPDLVNDSTVRARLRAKLADLAADATGSAQRVLRFAFLDAPLSIDAGELTDKGSINQRNVLRNRARLVDDLYADAPPEHVLSVDDPPKAANAI
jgi:feruloyl-CoA synthase